MNIRPNLKLARADDNKENITLNESEESENTTEFMKECDILLP